MKTIAMQSGALGIITTDGSIDIDTNDFPKQRVEDGRTLRTTLEVNGAQDTFAETRLYGGRVAEENLADVETVQIRADGGIDTGREETDVNTHVTEFTRVPGEFVTTESTDDEFAHEVIGDATGETIHPGHIDLKQLAESHPEAELWMGWFRAGGALNAGSAYGEINKEPDIAKYINQNENSQLGLEGFQFNGRELKLVVSRSGWVAVYEPSDMGEVEFSQLLHKEILPHAAPSL